MAVVVVVVIVPEVVQQLHLARPKLALVATAVIGQLRAHLFFTQRAAVAAPIQRQLGL
jgi:hypothetical protein